MIRAAVCLLFMFTAQSKINEKSHRAVLTVGLVLYAAAFACPLLFQGVSWIGAVLYIFFEAIANAFVIPRKESLLFLYVDKKERSRVYAMLHVIALAITSPFGTVMGAMSDAQPPVSLFICHRRFAGLRRADVLVPGRGDNRRLFCNGSIEKRIRPFFPCQHR